MGHAMIEERATKMGRAMSKLWLVAKHEYLRMVRRRSFLVGTLAVPALMAVVIGISIAVSVGTRDDRPLGYVDLAGVLDAGVRPTASAKDANGERRRVEVRAFADEAAARAALEEGTIQGFYVLPADYLRSGAVALVYWDDPPSDAVQDQFADLVRSNLVAELPEAVGRRAVEGLSLTVRAADGSREFSSRNWIAFVLPFGAGFFFMIVVMSSAGYLLQAVTTEKENRTMEVMITSMTPGQLVTGKAIGLMAVSLTQLVIWALAVVVCLLVGAQFLAPLRAARVPWATLGIAVAYFIPAYALVAGVMIAIGSAVTETRQGQQIASIVNLSFTLPFFFIALMVANPNSPILVALTLFPTTAFLTVTMRWSLAVVPAWQMALSWVLLVATAGLSVWAAARVLRVGMLRYGQRLDLRAALRALRKES
jgi:ABC-2 type transport system permease protein